ncbi:MAG: DUF6557 family protein [Prevotella sp.]|jgi:hypothetical protein|nr:hypothetical protein [Prevotella sp.]MBP8757127.1 hypothetical protein [Prevotella sp.]MDY0153717.1 hypothetical protein [Prevotella sp.]
MTSIKDLMTKISFNEVSDALKKLYQLDKANIDEFENTFNTLRTVKPTFDYFDMIIEVKEKDGKVYVSNTHLGSITDLAGRRFKVQGNMPDAAVAAHCLYQITVHEYETERFKDHLDEWDDDMMNPQKARIVR